MSAKGFSIPMNKSELVEAVAASSGLSKADAGRALDAVVGSITGALKAGESVNLIGSGTFDVRARAARTGRTPRTGAEIQIAAAKNPDFKAGKTLTHAVHITSRQAVEALAGNSQHATASLRGRESKTAEETRG